MNFRKEQKLIKYLNSLSEWREYEFEGKYPNFNFIEFDCLLPMNFEFCIISVSSGTITNSMRTFTYSDFITINEIPNYIADDYSNLNPALFSVVLDESVSEDITVNLDYCNRIYFQSSDPFCINGMS
ncbi:MAG: hypothetical protein Ta2E_11830 [Mycoplasmoidaceae bacterium]|nr:MAG: hypothetical protein Ta2E_11830 [Mycoplasmoidaceae bacterium]